METKGKKKFNLNFDLLQKLGKVLMTVIAVMPAAGLMISIGKLVQMAGADLSIVMTIGSTMARWRRRWSSERCQTSGLHFL